MTFDERWRLNLPRDRRKIQAELVDVPASAESPLDDPDESEIGRVLEWLEQSLESAQSGEPSCRWREIGDRFSAGSPQ